MTVTIKLSFFSLLSLTPRGDWRALAAQFAAAEFQHVPLRVSPALRVFYSSIAMSPWACISSYAPGFHTPSTSQRHISTLRRLIDFDEIDKRVSLLSPSSTPRNPPITYASTVLKPLQICMFTFPNFTDSQTTCRVRTIRNDNWNGIYVELTCPKLLGEHFLPWLLWSPNANADRCQNQDRNRGRHWEDCESGKQGERVSERRRNEAFWQVWVVLSRFRTEYPRVHHDSWLALQN